MEDGRRVRFNVKIDGTGWAFIPDYISDDEIAGYLTEMKAMYAGNKLWNSYSEISNIRPED